MLYTKKLNLNLPEDGDQYDVNLFNENARIIDGKLSDVSDAADAMTAKIPSAASAANQLADKGFVHDAIATNTAYFIGTFDSVEELEAYDGDLTNNDYAFVETTDTAGNVLYQRYKYNERKEAWEFEYSLNNTGFTAEQMDAINSGATAEKIGQIKAMTGATAEANGEGGLVPKPYAEDIGKFLGSDGTWQKISNELLLQTVFDIFVPPESIYVQFPGKKEPQELYSSVKSKWKKLNFNGAFFRANGGNAQHFDNQESPQGMMIQSHNHSITGVAYAVTGALQGTTSAGAALNINATGETGGVETRPVNYTIQIWERVE